MAWLLTVMKGQGGLSLLFMFFGVPLCYTCRCVSYPPFPPLLLPCRYNSDSTQACPVRRPIRVFGFDGQRLHVETQSFTIYKHFPRLHPSFDTTKRITKGDSKEDKMDDTQLGDTTVQGYGVGE